MLCQKRNQQFNWHGDFVFHPKLKEDSLTPNSDENLYCVSDFEENYFNISNIERYAIQLDGECGNVVRANIDEVDNQYGRFRKLTPRECLRLMGFDDSFKIVCSDTETYKQSGNSIIVDVLMALLKQMDITKYGEDYGRCNM